MAWKWLAVSRYRGAPIGFAGGGIWLTLRCGIRELRRKGARCGISQRVREFIFREWDAGCLAGLKLSIVSEIRSKCQEMVLEDSLIVKLFRKSVELINSNSTTRTRQLEIDNSNSCILASEMRYWGKDWSGCGIKGKFWSGWRDCWPLLRPLTPRKL